MIFFVASAAASSAYLTVGEIFPLEMRAFAIALFYRSAPARRRRRALAVRQLIGTGSGDNLFYGYLTAAVLMFAAGDREWSSASPPSGSRWEKIAEPLSAH